MRIRVKLFLSARRYATRWQDDRGRVEVDLPAGATLSDLLGALEIPHASELGVLVNGRNARPDLPLEDGDEVDIFPAMAGG